MARMHFRQRVAWLLVTIYLAATCSVVYYLFEISERYNVYAVDHVERYHNSDSEGSETSLFSVFQHVTDIPLAVWFVVLMAPYLQVFCMLMACTKPEPRMSLAFIWPVYVYLRCRYVYNKVQGQDIPKAYNTPLQNGHIVIDT